jgi:hypothetical protein
VLFTGNVLTDVESDHGRLVDSHVVDNLEKGAGAGGQGSGK